MAGTIRGRGSRLSIAARAEITTKYARAYLKASKKDKGRLLDEVIAVTRWSRDNTRRRLARAAAPRPRTVSQAGKPRGRKYSYNATKVLQRGRAFSGGMSGKYLAVAMPRLVDALERHGELLPGRGRYSAAVRGELLAMSPATIDRYLAPARAKDPLRGISTTKPSPLLRSSITIRKAGDEVAATPGSFEGDAVAHCGPTMKGEFCRTVDLTCMRTGWVTTRSTRNNAPLNVLAALQHAVDHVPFEVTGLDFDNGSEFINHDVIGWAADRKIFFTRSRPYKKNDQATIESKNNHLVRRYGFYWRYDTPETLTLLNQLWPLVNDSELPHPDEEARHLVNGHRRAPQTRLRYPADPARPTPGRRSPLPGAGNRTARPTRQAQPRPASPATSSRSRTGSPASPAIRPSRSKPRPPHPCQTPLAASKGLSE